MVVFCVCDHTNVTVTLHHLQVFVDRQCVGSLDYKTHELKLPDGKVLIFFSLPLLIKYEDVCEFSNCN